MSKWQNLTIGWLLTHCRTPLSTLHLLCTVSLYIISLFCDSVFSIHFHSLLSHSTFFLCIESPFSNSTSLLQLFILSISSLLDSTITLYSHSTFSTNFSLLLAHFTFSLNFWLRILTTLPLYFYFPLSCSIFSAYSFILLSYSTLYLLSLLFSYSTFPPPFLTILATLSHATFSINFPSQISRNSFSLSTFQLHAINLFSRFDFYFFLKNVIH